MPIKADEIAKLIELFQQSRWDEMHVEIDGMRLFLSTNPNARPTPSVVPAALAAPPAPQTKPTSVATDIPAHWMPVTAPNLGTFYRSPKPGAKPFVEVGDRVGPDSEVCLLEVMKLFTSVKAGAAGVVVRICATDSDLVEGGQVLFYLDKS
ncbi:MAG: acetyl-CoA carboxylase biotin carboxyl carrier protein subunit [Parvularculaceae bacterium]